MLPQDISAFSWSAEINLYSLLINMIIGASLSFILRIHYTKFGSVLSNRDELAHIFPMITLIIILIISIVKSSLALSLGLVGALSIVRFRTPIKEPEELGYLFLCIAIGLGLGANQKEATLLCFAVIIASMTFIKWHKKLTLSRNLHLVINWKDDSSNSQSGIEKIRNILGQYSKKINLRRFDSKNGENEAHFLIDLKETHQLDNIIQQINKEYTDAGIVFLDQKNIPSL